MRSKRGQIWIETVIYTLIALSLMGLILAFAKPKIESVKDRMLIEQTIESMNKISEQISEVQIAPGNRRVLSIKVNKGSIYIDPQNNSISWIIDSMYKYSEIGRIVRLGGLYVLTEGVGPYKVSIMANYTTSLTLEGSEDEHTFESSPTPYSVSVASSNVGGSINVDLIFR